MSGTDNVALDKAFARLLEDHKAILYKVAYTYCREAEARRDLMQEMCIQLWRALPGYDDGAGVKLSTWVTRVAMNVAISGLRTATRRNRHEIPAEAIGIDIDAAMHLDDAPSDNMRALRQLIDAMDELNRALILLYLEGYDAEEIANVLGISPSNVTTRMTRLKQKLTVQFADINSAGEPQ